MLAEQPSASREDAYRASNIGVAYLEQYDYEAAAKSFRRALAIDGSLVLARINLAIAYFHGADLAAARREAEAAVSTTPDAPHVHYILGLIAKAENRVADAIAAFGRVLAIDDRDVGTRVQLAQLHLQQQEYDRAAALLRPAIEAEPYHVTALYTLALALMRGGQAGEGRQVMADFQRIREAGYATAFSNNYLEQGRYAEAITSTGAEAELVDRALPRVRFAVTTRIAAAEVSDPGSGSSRARTAALGPLGRGVTLADFDGDGDLDLLDVSSGRLRAFANDKGRFTDATPRLRLAQPASGFVPVAIIAGDYDNDGRPDLFVPGAGGHALYRQTESGTFEDVTARAGITKTSGFFRSAAFVDIDHDGDLDLFLVGTLADGGEPLPAPDRLDGLPANNVLLRNNGNGTFTDITAEARLATPPLHGYAVVPTDYDNRRDVDLLVAGPGRAPVLFKNLRDGSFRDVAAEVGLPGAGQYAAVAAADVDKDGFTDFFFGRTGEPSILMFGDGRGGFRAAAAAPASENVTAAQFLDYDNDGLLDLVAVASEQLQIRRNLGREWADVTAVAVPEELRARDSGERLHSFAAGDLDGDGDSDLVVKTGGGDLVVLENQGGSRNRSLTVRLTGRVSNRSAIGARVELRAGSLRQRLEVSSAWPAPASADLVFGLGTRAQADVVRVLWPAGILQSELPEPGARVLALTELDRKPSSCPYLFTWSGGQFEFLTDFMGGGEMGYAVAPGIWNTPDPDEYTRIPGDRLRPRDGRYEIRVTNELEEALFVDRLQLVAIDHAADVEVHPREGLFAPPFPGFQLFAAADIRPPVLATDHAGRDVLERLRHLDRRFVDDLPLERIRGYAKEHALTIDLGPSAPGAPVLLLLTGWTDYAFSSDNIAAHQAGLRLVPPSLQVRDAAGQWTTVVPEVGIPLGRPQTLTVDLTGKFLSESREVRIVTTLRIYWDQLRVARLDPAVELRLTRLDALAAELRWRGFSAHVAPDGREPFTYDYARVSPHSPWKTMPGRYTREGDVRELLLDADDRFIVSRPGDEVAISFDASGLAELPAGWTRTFLLYSVGYSKEMDRNSASPDQVWPLPFRAMTRYPYSPPETYPQTAEHRDYLDRWNTRVVGRPVPPLELPLTERSGNRR